jgi:hypothetical protein
MRLNTKEESMPLFGSNKKPCANCSQSIDANARFCPFCGEPTSVILGPCPHCGHPVAADAKFCSNCRRELTTDRAPDLRSSVWRKSPDEFATRVESSDLRGRLYKELEVQPGQQVILLVDGRADEGRVGPGRYTIDSFFEKILTLGAGRHVTALLIDGGFVPLEFLVPDVFTADDHAVAVQCKVGVQVANPMSFFVNVIKSTRAITLNDLRNFMFDQVRAAVADVLGGQTFRGLVTGLVLRDQMANAVEQHLNETLATSGLRFGGVLSVDVRHPRLEALRSQWEDIRIAREQATADRTQDGERRMAEVQARQVRFEAELAALDQETAEQRAKVHVFEQRAEVYEEMRRAILSDKMNEVKTGEDFGDFLAEINRRQVLRQEQLDVLAEDYANRKENRVQARAHVAYLAELERDYNRKQAELVWRTDYTLDQMASELKIDQQRLAAEGLLDEGRWQNDMAGMKRTAGKSEWERAEAQKADIFNRQQQKDALGHQLEMQRAQTLQELEVQAIRTDAALSEAQKRAQSDLAVTRQEVESQRIRHEEQMRQQRAEDEADMKLAGDGVDLLAKLKQNKLAAEEIARRIAREDELTRADAALKHDLARKEAERLDKAQAQAHELAMLQARAEMSAEALLSLSGPEQAWAIADLKQTEALKGLTDEQVYALMAAKSPDVARALEERFKAAAAHPQEVEAQTRALYERMLADIQKDREKEADLHQRTEDRFQQMFTQALDSQRSGMVEIAKATSGSQPPASGPVIITNPVTGQPQIIQTGGSGGAQVSGGEVQVCPRCRVKSPVGERYCNNCGFSFYEV